MKSFKEFMVEALQQQAAAPVAPQAAAPVQPAAKPAPTSSAQKPAQQTVPQSVAQPAPQKIEKAKKVVAQSQDFQNLLAQIKNDPKAQQFVKNGDQKGLETYLASKPLGIDAAKIASTAGIKEGRLLSFKEFSDNQLFEGVVLDFMRKHNKTIISAMLVASMFAGGLSGAETNQIDRSEMIPDNAIEMSAPNDAGTNQLAGDDLQVSQVQTPQDQTAQEEFGKNYQDLSDDEKELVDIRAGEKEQQEKNDHLNRIISKATGAAKDIEKQTEAQSDDIMKRQEIEDEAKEKQQVEKTLKQADVISKRVDAIKAQADNLLKNI